MESGNCYTILLVALILLVGQQEGQPCFSTAKSLGSVVFFIFSYF